VRKLLVLLLLFSQAYAVDYSPWFAPPWQFQGTVGTRYEHSKKIQSPKGNFNALSNEYFLDMGLAVTPWPYWNVEAEFAMFHSQEIDFAYQVANITVRYAWLDDIAGDPISLVTGVTVALPGNHFLKELTMPYHGNVNTEIHASIGKEFTCRGEWKRRFWALGGWGFANKGSTWVHGFLAWEESLNACMTWSLGSDLLFGLGNEDLIEADFNGYADIGYQVINLATALNYQIPYVGTLQGIVLYNVYARNFAEHFFGLSLHLIVPFSF